MTRPTERELFAAAIERHDPAERQAYLAAACGTDRELHRHIELLVAAHESDDDFMACPAEPSEGQPTDSASAQTLAMENDSSVSTPGSVSRGTRPEQRLAAGTFFGRYRIEYVLGRGGMATVYLATDLRLNRRVAIKVPRFDAESAPELVERFEREARVMASVEHRNLCGIYDVGEIDGVRFLSMEFVDGETLAQVLERGEQFPPRRIAELLRKLALATRRAHQAGVVHRDLKPANVIIDREGEPVVMDFGLAHAPSEDARLTNAGYIMGTPAYMAPEQALGDPNKVGPLSDIYSLGAILYELLTGRPVYTGSLSLVLGQLVSDQPVVAPRSIRREIDPALEAICLKALSRQPEDRFASAETLAEALDRFLDPVKATTKLALEETPPAGKNAARSTRGRMLAVTAVLLALLGLAAVIVIQTSHGEFVLTTDDPDIATLLDQHGGIVVEDRATKQTYRLRRGTNRVLPSGNFDLIVTTPAGLELETPKFQLSRLGRVRATVIARAAADAVKPHPLLSPDYVWSEPMNLGPGVNTEADEENACVSADGLTLLFNRREAGRQMLWESRRTRGDEPFGAAVKLGATLNLAGFDHETPFLSSDGLTLWYASSRPPTVGPRDLWVSRRETVDAPWGEPVNLGPKVNTPGFEQTPFVTADGLTLLFSRAPRIGAFEICQASRPSLQEAFETPQVLANVNGGDTSSFPRLTADGLTLVFVFSPTGSRKLRLMAAVRAAVADEFQPPRELDGISVHDPIFGTSLSADGLTLHYSAAHPQHPENRFDLWSVTRVPRQ